MKLEQILSDALAIATENIDKEKFHSEYKVAFDDGYDGTNVEISLDYHFTKKYPHLIIRRRLGIKYIDIYSKINNKFEKVVSYEEFPLTYVNDTIQDVNGDGLKDFVINWYGSTGCCLKAWSSVYLLRPDKKTFSNDFDFINPTFSPKEKIIRGVCYGQPGETEMYKYKWDGEKVDTLEYVYYEMSEKGERTGKIIISNNHPFEDNHKILKRLNFVPNEYRKIEGYDWFVGFE